MDAALVRAYLRSLPDIPPDERSVERVRTCLASLQSPDVRYLVATVLGTRAGEVARVAASVLRAAGAPTATLGARLDDALVDGRPIDDALLAKAGTMAASSGYQLAATAAHLGEVTAREGALVLALTAFADANQRVVLLLDPVLNGADPVHAPRPDLVVIAPGADPEKALALVPDATPLVLAVEARSAEERVAASGVPALIGGRDFALRDAPSGVELLVRDEPYVTFEPPEGIDRGDLATGIATALALGAMGIRMREEWVTNGVRALDPAAVAS